MLKRSITRMIDAASPNEAQAERLFATIWARRPGRMRAPRLAFSLLAVAACGVVLGVHFGRSRADMLVQVESKNSENITTIHSEGITTILKVGGQSVGFSMHGEIKDTTVGEFLYIVGVAAQHRILVADCAAKRKVTLKLQRAPLELVIRTVASQAGLYVTEAFDGTHVDCVPPELQTELRLSVHAGTGKPLARIVGEMAHELGVDYLPYDGPPRIVKLELEQVRFTTAAAVLADVARVHVKLEGGQLAATPF
jgi:hypothetical protein